MPQHVCKRSSNSAVYETSRLITIDFMSKKSFTIEQKTVPAGLIYSWAFNSVPGMSGYKRGYFFQCPILILAAKMSISSFFFYFTTQTRLFGNTSERVAACLA